ncbi:MAG: hypothetical protein IPG43_22480 [Proteobacteria bacterium]|nr:hypothetical protein [Pseudomonadota bacterium]
MGLATVHGIVHEYGGHIVVESVLGFGTRFRILLPGDASVPEHALVARGSAAVHARRPLAGKVLLVDDNFVVGEFLQAARGRCLSRAAGGHPAQRLSAVEARDALPPGQSPTRWRDIHGGRERRQSLLRASRQRAVAPTSEGDNSP